MRLQRYVRFCGSNLQTDLDTQLTTLDNIYNPASATLTYAQALQSAPSSHLGPPNIAPGSNNRRPGRNPELEITLVQSDTSQPVYATTKFSALKSKVEGILGELGIDNTAAHPLAIRTISRHPSKDTAIALHTTEDAQILRSHASQCVPKLSTLPLP